MAVTKSSPSSLEQYGVGVGWGRKVRIAGVGESLSCRPITERTPSRGRPKELIRRTGALGKATISSGKARKRVPGAAPVQKATQIWKPGARVGGVGGVVGAGPLEGFTYARLETGGPDLPPRMMCNVGRAPSQLWISVSHLKSRGSGRRGGKQE